jgi:hypothetical protein
MKEYLNDEEVLTGTGDQTYKVHVTAAGTATMQQQASDEGFDNIIDGSFTATADGVVRLGTGKFRVQLTGDARFFMG